MSCGNCGYNSLIIGKSTNGNIQAASCNTTCGSSGSNSYNHTTPVYQNNCGYRPNREKVVQQIREYILNMLGAPVIQLELDEQNITFCINQALMIIEEYAGREYFTYYTFRTTPGVSVYEMPPDIGYIRQVDYKQEAQFHFQSSDLDGAIPLEYFYNSGGYQSILGGLVDPLQPVWGRASEWSIYKGYERLYSRMSSNIGGWEWIGGYRHIKLYPTPYKGSVVVVNYIQKCKDWVQVTQAMQEGALSYAKEILGRIRSKYQTPPGAGGTAGLDGSQLLQEAKEEREAWKQDLLDKFGDFMPITYG